MRNAHWMALAALAVLSSCDSVDDKVCAAGTTESCTCPDTGASGNRICSEDGMTYSACNCDCEAAGQVCSDDAVYQEDQCGNLAPFASELCWCACEANSTTCPSFVDPMDTFSLPTSCHDMSACIVREVVNCEEQTFGFVYGATFKNTCAETLRCYHRDKGRYSITADGYSNTSGCSFGAQVPQYDDLGAENHALAISTTLEDCQQYALPSYQFLMDWVCVLDSDSSTECLPITNPTMCNSHPFWPPCASFP